MARKSRKNMMPLKADVINTFIEEEIPRLKEKIRSLPEERRQGYDELNTLFLKYLR